MKKTKLNFTENYDPIKALKQSKTEDGLPAYEPLVKDGIVQVERDRIIMVPKVHLDGNAYRDWFLHAYPNGRTKIIRRTGDPILSETGTLIYPQEVFEVEFYLDMADEHPKTSGFGRAKYEPNNEFDEMSTAITNAFKNGMRNMGFGVDIDQDALKDDLPKFGEKTFGYDAPYVPLPTEQKTYSQLSETAAEVFKEVEQETTEKTPYADISEPAKEVLQDTVQEIQNPVLAHIAANNAEAETLPDTKLEGSLPKMAEPAAAEEESPFSSLEEALDTEIVVLEGATPAYKALAGKKIRDLDERSLMYLGKSDLKKWEDKISEETRNAAVFVVKNK